MSGLKSFLTPGWVLTAVIIILFAYLAFTVLAPWQLGKNERTQARNHQLEEAFHSTPQPLDQLLTPTAPPTVTDDKEWARAKMTGRYLPDQEVILRNRPVNSAPAFQLLTPFKTDRGTIIVVNRGFVEPKEGAQLPPIPAAPQGEVTVDGFLRPDEPHPVDREPLNADGAVQVYGINAQQIGEAIDQPQLVRGFLQLDADQPGVANPIPLPQLSSGPYLSYGIQWIASAFWRPWDWRISSELRSVSVAVFEKRTCCGKGLTTPPCPAMALIPTEATTRRTTALPAPRHILRALPKPPTTTTPRTPPTTTVMKR